eukprot:CAMPEP_0180026266 /NCGR_PEP_ID=MMETSP0984-20121128/25096_1 /TAXON_ID=483367 /ORGANISM="non described non described, Strain CCMP 2436" /LENGTH=53 /DNA_ID=CAMNT_0021950951 /DNA_START=41 /DNA_END=199 /DNA_ORIENTATION=+
MAIFATFEHPAVYAAGTRFPALPRLGGGAAGAWAALALAGGAPRARHAAFEAR